MGQPVDGTEEDPKSQKSDQGEDKDLPAKTLKRAFSAKYEEGVQRFFRHVAGAVTAHPVLILLLITIPIFGIGFGVFEIDIEDDVYELWVDDTTRLKDVSLTQKRKTALYDDRRSG